MTKLRDVVLLHRHRTDSEIAEDILQSCKVCSYCSCRKSFDKFYRRVNSADGYGNICKRCSKARGIKYRETHAIKLAAQSRSYNLQNRFGITVEDYNKMLESQEGKCKICGGSDKKRLAVDHNHLTGKVRGLLCSACNKALGGFQDSKSVLKSAIKYLEVHDD